jgi:tagatose 6-phosphate kinase
MILTVCANPVLQKTLVLPTLEEGEVNRCTAHYLDVSGKGINVSRVLSQLDVPVLHLTHKGGELETVFNRLLCQERFQCITVPSHSEIRFCYTLLHQTHQSTTEVVEEAHPVASGTEEQLRSKYTQVLPRVSMVILSGTKARGYSDSLFPDMVAEAKASGKRVILDYRGADLIHSLPYNPDVVKPNLKEFCATFFPSSPIQEQWDMNSLPKPVQEKALELAATYHTTVILTHGKSGIYYTDAKQMHVVKPQPITPVNTIGSGDAFTAGVASVLYAGGSMHQAIEKGEACGRLNALQVQPGSIQEKMSG